MRQAPALATFRLDCISESSIPVEAPPPQRSADNERALPSRATRFQPAVTARTSIISAAHRIRQFIVAATDAHTQEGRDRRMERVRALLQRFAAVIGGADA